MFEIFFPSLFNAGLHWHATRSLFTGELRRSKENWWVFYPIFRLLSEVNVSMVQIPREISNRLHCSGLGPALASWCAWEQTTFACQPVLLLLRGRSCTKACSVPAGPRSRGGQWLSGLNGFASCSRNDHSSSATCWTTEMSPVRITYAECISWLSPGYSAYRNGWMSLALWGGLSYLNTYISGWKLTSFVF